MEPSGGERAAADRGVAHDLRNLLTAIALHAELARTAIGDGHPATADLDDLLAATARARRLAIAWLAGPLPDAVPAAPVPLDALVAGALPLVRAVAGPGVAVEALLGTPEPVRIDPLALERILVNLVLNACEAAPGPGTVLVTTTSIAGGRLAVAVTDRGPGMPPGLLGRLASGDPTPEGADGHGIGLPTVLALAASAGGTVDALPAPGGGTTVRLLLPPG